MFDFFNRMELYEQDSNKLSALIKIYAIYRNILPHWKKGAIFTTTKKLDVNFEKLIYICKTRNIEELVLQNSTHNKKS